LLLVARILRAQAEDLDAERGELGAVIAKSARLWCTAARAGGLVPAWGRIVLGPARSRIGVRDHASSHGQIAQRDRASGGRPQGIGSDRHPEQVTACTIIHGSRKGGG